MNLVSIIGVVVTVIVAVIVTVLVTAREFGKELQVAKDRNQLLMERMNRSEWHRHNTDKRNLELEALVDHLTEGVDKTEMMIYLQGVVDQMTRAANDYQSKGMKMEQYYSYGARFTAEGLINYIRGRI